MAIKFETDQSLIPAIIKNADTEKVIMMVFMNTDSLQKTKETGLVTYYNTLKKEIWIKGVNSGNYLEVIKLEEDERNNTIQIHARPKQSGETEDRIELNTDMPEEFLFYLQKLIETRKEEMPENSYTTKLFKKGINKIAQKVGEEAVELIIEAKDQDKKLFLNEAADLIYHLLVLLTAKDTSINDVIAILKERHK